MSNLGYLSTSSNAGSQHRIIYLSVIIVIYMENFKINIIWFFFLKKKTKKDLQNAPEWSNLLDEIKFSFSFTDSKRKKKKSKHLFCCLYVSWLTEMVPKVLKSVCKRWKRAEGHSFCFIGTTRLKDCPDVKYPPSVLICYSQKEEGGS